MLAITERYAPKQWSDVRDRRCYRRSGLRKRKRPRPTTGTLRVRDRLEAVEMPLKRTNQSRNARQRPFLSAMRFTQPRYEIQRGVEEMQKQDFDRKGLRRVRMESIIDLGGGRSISQGLEPRSFQGT